MACDGRSRQTAGVAGAGRARLDTRPAKKMFLSPHAQGKRFIGSIQVALCQRRLDVAPRARSVAFIVAMLYHVFAAWKLLWQNYHFTVAVNITTRILIRRQKITKIHGTENYQNLRHCNPQISL
jgi:hypothetical protein